MFRFSIRDLLWLTLAVALGLGWLVRERQLLADVNQATNRGAQWQMAAGALKHVLEEDCYQVELDFDARELFLTRTLGSMSYRQILDMTSFAARIQDD